MGLLATARKRYRHYSLGMKQRLGIAASLLTPRELIVLDEPTNGLDPQGTREVRGLIRQIAADGTTVFVSSHLLGEVEQVCSHVGVMRAGRLVFQGPLEELRATGAARIRVETAEPAAAAAVLERLGLADPRVAGNEVSAQLAGDSPSGSARSSSGQVSASAGSGWSRRAWRTCSWDSPERGSISMSETSLAGSPARERWPGRAWARPGGPAGRHDVRRCGSRPGVATSFPVGVAAGFPAPPEPGAPGGGRGVSSRHRHRAAPHGATEGHRGPQRGVHHPARRRRGVPQLHRADLAAHTGDAVGGGGGRRGLSWPARPGDGTLRSLLAIPAGRVRLLTVKYAAIVVFAVAVTFLVAAVALATGAALFPVGPVTLLSGTTVPIADAMLRLLFVALYVAAAMASLGAMGMTISTFTEHAVGAIAATAIVVVTSEVVDKVPQFAAIQPYLPTHWWTSFDSLLRVPVDTTTLLRGLLSFGAYLAISGSITWARFTTADVTS